MNVTPKENLPSRFRPATRRPVSRRVVGGVVTVLMLFGLVTLLCAETTPAAEDQKSENGSAAEEPRPTPQPRPVRRSGDRVSVFSGDILVPENVEQWGSLVSIGGDVLVEGRVRGDVVVIGGSLKLTGSVRGDVVGVLSSLDTRNAEIGGQLVNVAGTLLEENTRVRGQKVNIGFGRGWFSLSRPLGVLGSLLAWGRLVLLLIVFLLVLLLAALAPERIRIISEEVPQRLFAAFFIGLLGYLGLWIAMALLAVTVVGVVLVLFLFLILKWLGIAGMFHFFGHRVGRALGREPSLLGAILIGFVPYALILLLPSAFGLPGFVVACLFAVLIWLFLEIPAVGLVILTGAGSRSANRSATSSPQPSPAPPAPSPPPSDTGGAPERRIPERTDPGRNE
jgi:hypothetical protein